MRYITKERISYSRVDAWERLSLPGLMDYFQDCIYFQGEDLNLGAKRVLETKRGWVIASWHIEVERYPLVGERVTIETFATGFQVFKGMRNVRMLDEAGGQIAAAESVWVFMDFERQRPAKPLPEEYEAYGIEEPLELKHPLEGKRLKMPELNETLKELVIRRDQIDTNGHVNNCQYVRMALDSLPEAMDVQSIHVEYHKSAVLGDVVIPKVEVQKDKTYVSLCDVAGSEYTGMELIGEYKHEV